MNTVGAGWSLPPAPSLYNAHHPFGRTNKKSRTDVQSGFGETDCLNLRDSAKDGTYSVVR